MRVLLLLLSLVAAASAESTRIPFTLPKSQPVAVALSLPSGASVVSHKKTEKGDEIAARISGEETLGLVVEVSDPAGHVLWRHDFGFNQSQDSCSIEVSCHSTLPMVLVEYKGYKWDHAHKLLFVETGASQATVREYASARTDILPFLRKQNGFEDDYEYWIYPFGFTPRGVTFECIPLQKPELMAAHPFAQDAKWYQVTATVGNDFKILPTDVTITH